MNPPYHTKALPEGTLLREWRLERVLGVGGFGIVYRGRGTYFNELVAIKEYFPGAISDRIEATVTPTDSSSEEIYTLGLQKFVEEAKVLWALSQPERHPNIVSVRSLFEIHGTAYMVMDFESGVSLSQMLREGSRFDEDSLMRLVRPIAEGLDRAHRAGVLHRDIKPANILVDDDGRPVLIDFGSARFDAGQATSTKVTFYTPPYAALEQYVKTYAQGPWTDIYALGVVLYQCVTGEKPPEVLERLHGGLGEPLSSREWPGFSRAFTYAVDAAMGIRPTDRPQSVAEWLALFDREPPPAAPRAAAADDDEMTRIARPMASTPPPPAPSAAIATAAPTALPPEPATSPPRRGSPVGLWIGAGAVSVAAIAGGVWWVAGGGHAPTPRPAQVAPAAAAAPAGIAPAGLGPSDQKLAQTASSLVDEARAAGRPAAEVDALSQQAALVGDLLGKAQAASSGPGGAARAAALKAELDQGVAAHARGEDQALQRAAEPKLREAEGLLKGARTGDASGALATLRQAMSQVTAAAASAGSASDASAALDATHSGFTAYQQFKGAYVAATAYYAPALRTRLSGVADEARATANQVIAAAAGPKPWLFSSDKRKAAYKALQDNAAKARAALSQLGDLSAAAQATSDVRQLNGAVAKATVLKQSMQTLLAASAAAQSAK